MLSHPVRGLGAWGRIIVAGAALALASLALGFLIWALTVRGTTQLAWLTSMATVLAVVLPSWGMSTAMLAWVVKSRRAEADSGAAGYEVSGIGQVVVGEIPREPAGFQPRAALQAKLMATEGVAVLSAVTGGRGIGKTQLAGAIARRRITERWPVVAWIVAEDSEPGPVGDGPAGSRAERGRC